MPKRAILAFKRNSERSLIIMIGYKAPSIQAKAVKGSEIIENFSLDDYLGKYVLLFFYPLDFTFVCPTELHAFQEALHQFRARNAEVVACSVDSCYSHLAWLNTTKKAGGIEGIEYPIISDLKKEVATAYRVLKEDDGIALRGQFLLDKQGIVRHMLVNDLPIGRSVEEALRLLDALIAYETHGEVCPANWRSGETLLQPSSLGLKTYFEVR